MERSDRKEGRKKHLPQPQDSVLEKKKFSFLKECDFF